MIRRSNQVVLVVDIPGKLKKGSVGYVEDVLPSKKILVDFCDSEGRTYVKLELDEAQVVKLRHGPFPYLEEEE